MNSNQKIVLNMYCSVSETRIMTKTVINKVFRG